METHWLEGTDGLALRLVRWSEGGSPVLICTGRNESLEKYHEIAGGFAHRGYSVWGMDWRGQGLSGREIGRAARGHVGSFTSYVDDLRVVLRHVGGSPILFAHSMGGHIGLRYAHGDANAFRVMMLSSPMIDIRTRPLPRKAVTWLARTARTVGLSEAYLPGHRTLVARNARFRRNVLTANRERFDWIAALHRNHPELITGGATFGWLAAATESIDVLGQPGYAEMITTPTLILSAGNDRVVDNRAHRHFAERMPNAQRVTISGARHELPQETAPRLEHMWRAIDAFLTGR